MTSNRYTVRADAFCSSVRDGTHSSPKRVAHGRYLITSRHIVDGRIDLSNAYQISELDFEEINRRSKVERWDVLISMIGTVGVPCLVREEPDFAIKNIGLFKSTDELHAKWLYYYLTSPAAQRRFEEHARGTTQAYIPLGALREFPISVPTNQKEMEEIVDLLSTIDEKIELNRRTNETLEEMGRALFKSWFVGFDPVRAKAEGHDPGVPPEIAGLFPGRFTDSDAGEIPEGWNTGPLSEIAELRTESVWPNREPDAQWEHFSLPAFDAGCRPALVQGSEIKSNKYAVPNTSVLVSKLNPQFPRIWAPEPRHQPRSVCSTEFMPFVPRHSAWRGFLLETVRSERFQAEMNGRVTGSTGSRQRVPPREVAAIPVVWPPADIAEALILRFNDFQAKAAANTEQSATLAELRDTLLPKLISGEIRIKQAEQAVEEAV